MKIMPLVLLCGLFLSISGCELIDSLVGGPNNDPIVAKQTWVDRAEQLEVQFARATDAVADVESKIDGFQEQLVGVVPESEIARKINEGIDKFQVELAKAQEYENQIEASLAETRARIDSIETGDGATGQTVAIDGIAHVAGSAAAVAPGPWSVGLGIVSTALLGISDFMRRRRKRIDAEAIAQKDAEINRFAMAIDGLVDTTDVLKTKDPAFWNTTGKQTFAENLNPDAKKVITERRVALGA